MYYVVKSGRTPGIYNSWDEIRPLVEQFSGAEFKKFNNILEANSYLEKNVKNNNINNINNNTLENFFPKINKKNNNINNKNKKYNNYEINNKNKMIRNNNNKIFGKNLIDNYLENNSSNNTLNSNFNININNKLIKNNLNFGNPFSDFLNVYTDGSCLNNGKNKKRGCGFAAIFKDFEEYNIYNAFNIGERTNNRAELFAIISSIKSFSKTFPQLAHSEGLYSSL